MNSHPAPCRPVAVLAIGLALVVSSCGGGQSDEEVADTTIADTTIADTAAPTAPAMEPASVTFDAQDSDGTTITIASIELPAPGFVAVHADRDGSPGAVIGNSDLLPAGESSDLTVTLDSTLDRNTTLHPMVHIDTDDNGRYEFGEVEGADGPGLTSDGQVAVTGAAVTVDADTAEAAGNTDDTTPVGGDTITIADFAFTGVTEIPVGTTVVVTNSDPAPHTFTAENGTFDSGSLAAGDTFEFTLDTPGEFAYFCNFHPSMTGTITVTG